VRELAAAGADLEAADPRTGETPLHIAVSKGHEGCLRALLELGASLEAADHHAHTALHWAAASGQQGCLRVLLERGASLAAIDCNGLTAVALAAGKGQQACLHALLEGGATPLCVDKLNNSALHIAACNGSLPAIRCLAAAGVALSAQNNLGQTPRQASRAAEGLHASCSSMGRSCVQEEEQEQEQGPCLQPPSHLPGMSASLLHWHPIDASLAPFPPALQVAVHYRQPAAERLLLQLEKVCARERRSGQQPPGEAG
jgi:hypothetical protein